MKGQKHPLHGKHMRFTQCAHRSPPIMCVLSLWDANNIIVLGMMAASTTWLQYMIIMSLHLFIFPVWAGQPHVWSAGPAHASRGLIILLKWRSLVLGRLPRLIYSPEKTWTTEVNPCSASLVHQENQQYNHFKEKIHINTRQDRSQTIIII